MSGNKNDDLVNAALKGWCQGDCTIGEYWFIYRSDSEYPLVGDSRGVSSIEENIIESRVAGFVVLTQTCDLVRNCQDRPFLEISPLVEVDADRLQEVKKMKRPQYAYVPGVAEQNLIADLDRVMTIGKSIVATWKRIAGCRNDQEVIDLGRALARKRSRFAFPDDFNLLTQSLQKRMQNKHGKNTPEGLALLVLSEIRVQAMPFWDADTVSLMFWFIRPQDDDPFTDTEWSKFLSIWLDLTPTSRRYQSINGAVKLLEDLTAKEYVESRLLDLDRLSTS